MTHEDRVDVAGNVHPRAMVIVKRGAVLTVQIVLDDDVGDFVVALSGPTAEHGGTFSMKLVHAMEAIIDAVNSVQVDGDSLKQETMNAD